MQTQKLKIQQVREDDTLYPRLHSDFVTVGRYINSMKSGSEFPPITVALFKNNYFLVDGLHRLLAMRSLKKKDVEVEILTGLTKKQIYLEAIKRNINHGRQFSTQEVVGICVKLEHGFKLTQSEISEIIRIPVTQLKPFVAKRIVRITETEEILPLKSSLRHFAGENVPFEFISAQSRLTPARTQEKLINNVIILIKRDLIDRKNQKIARKLIKLHKLLSAYI